MSLRHKLITPASDEVVSLNEFKQHIKWDPTDSSEDAIMRRYIKAATDQAEQFTRRIIQPSSWQTSLEYFPGSVKMDIGPIDLETLVIKYYDTDNVEQTLSDSLYFIHENGDDDFIEIEFDGTMPTLYDRYYPIVLEYTAGYSEVPSGIKLAIMMQAATFFSNRENEAIGGGARSVTQHGTLHLLYPYKIMN